MSTEPTVGSGITFSLGEVAVALAFVAAFIWSAYKFVFTAIVRKVREHDSLLAAQIGVNAKMVTEDKLTVVISAFTTKLEESERRRADQFDVVDRRFEERMERLSTHFEQRNAISDQRFESRMGEIKKEIVENNAKEAKQRHEESQWQQRLQTKVDTVVVQNEAQFRSIDKLERTVETSTSKLETKLEGQVDKITTRVSALETKGPK